MSVIQTQLRFIISCHGSRYFTHITVRQWGDCGINCSHSQLHSPVPQCVWWWVVLHGNGWHSDRNRGNNCRDGDKSREQSGNTAVMGFRFSGNTAGNKGHKRDGRSEALSNKTAWRSSKVKPKVSCVLCCRVSARDPTARDALPPWVTDAIA